MMVRQMRCFCGDTHDGELSDEVIALADQAETLKARRATPASLRQRLIEARDAKRAGKVHDAKP